MQTTDTTKAERRVGARLLGGFQKFARTVTRTSGHPMAFGLAIGIIVVWALTGPLFDYGTTWLLVIDCHRSVQKGPQKNESNSPMRGGHFIAVVSR